ncbi:MAG: hypothetical protein HDQ97_00270 [Lachnospiraceae bacterium]|nr:hypothetical protein [Lachnospiraceae bacterium]
MATDEEYLDSLLKSMTDNEQNRSMDEVMREVTKTPKEDEKSFEADPFLENPSEMNDETPEQEKDTEASVSEVDEWELGLDEILAQADSQRGEDNTDSLFDMSDWASADQSMDVLESVNGDTGSANMSSMDVTDLIDNMDNTDLDLEEINGLLKRADSKENVNDEMLALLEGVDVTQMDGFADSDVDSEFSIFSESDLEKSANYGSGSDNFEENSKGKKKKEKKAKKDKAKSKRFGKKKKESAILEENEEASQDGLNLDNLLNGVESDPESGDSGQDEKKTGFFSKVMDYLMEEDDEEEENTDGNPAAVDESGEAGDKEAPKKGKKKKKADKKGKGKGKGTEESSEEEADEEAESKSKTKKKPKKEKKEKTPKEKVKGEKVLSTKKLMVLIAFCATIIACITVLGTFLPEYADKQNAREAFYEGDYETVYKLLYDKQLSNSDLIIYNRAEVVMRLKRKLQSYDNNMALNRELEAVDALIQGVNSYHNLMSTETYGASEELDVLYRQICAILENNYGITPEVAAEMNAYDNVQYTMKLKALISGTAAAAPLAEETAEEPKESEEPDTLQDVLAEEEDIINY